MNIKIYTLERKIVLSIDSTNLLVKLFFIIVSVCCSNLFVTYRGDILNFMLLVYQNVDIAMSWLSTLGGAFSVLGDNFEHCVSIICNNK